MACDDSAQTDGAYSVICASKWYTTKETEDAQGKTGSGCYHIPD